jgi:uroporphyrinogen-III synthase
MNDACIQSATEAGSIMLVCPSSLRSASSDAVAEARTARAGTTIAALGKAAAGAVQEVGKKRPGARSTTARVVCLTRDGSGAKGAAAQGAVQASTLHAIGLGHDRGARATGPAMGSGCADA